MGEEQQDDAAQPSPDDPELAEKLMLAINTPPLYPSLVRHCAGRLRGSEYAGEDGVGEMTLRVARHVGLYTTYRTCGWTDPLPRLAHRDARRTCSWLLRRAVRTEALTEAAEGQHDSGLDAVLDDAWLEAQIEDMAEALGLSTEVPMVLLRGLVDGVGNDTLRAALELVTGEPWTPGQVRTRLSRLRTRVKQRAADIADELGLDLPRDDEKDQEEGATDDGL